MSDTPTSSPSPSGERDWSDLNVAVESLRDLRFSTLVHISALIDSVRSKSSRLRSHVLARDTGGRDPETDREVRRLLTLIPEPGQTLQPLNSKDWSSLATQGDLSAALPFLQEALSLAEPQGFVRIFVDEGTLMASLLYQALQAGIAPAYVTRLIAAFGGNQESAAPLQTGALDPLSDRELDVLRLLGTDLTGPEIADQLMVSLNTMRTHSKNIYSKLGVNSRRAAVRRAEELNLI